MSESHPTYPNPTIQEAVCEIHFRLPGDVPWNPAFAGELFKRIQTDFPHFEPAATMGVQVEVGPAGMAQRMLPILPRMQFRHRERPLLRQLSPFILTVNVLPKYPGWATVLEDILAGWRDAVAVTAASAVRRIGLRYIDRIDRTRPDERPGDWIAPSDYIPKYVLSSLPGFLSRLEARPAEQDRVVITLGEIAATAESPGAIMLDIDCITEKQIAAADDAKLRKEISTLHDRCWEIFEASLTPRLRKLLEEGAQ